MRILQINTADKGGGAEGSARNLFERYRRLGHESWLAVGRKYSVDSGVYEIPRPAPACIPGKSLHFLAVLSGALEGHVPGMRKGRRILERLSRPERFFQWSNGLEERDFPGTRHVLDMLPGAPDIVHCHNLHGWYFDLTYLEELSRRFPVILNLRDAWLLTGHCAYFMDCDRWLDGCGDCPRLGIYPAIHKDGTRENWRWKASIYRRSRLYVTAPSQWLLDCARKSMLQAVDWRVIPNGIDTDVFRPGDRMAARAALGLPQLAGVVMFAAASSRNIYKDPETLFDAVGRMAERRPDLHFLCVGLDVPKGLKVRNLHLLPYVSEPSAMARCYSAADVFMHTARAEAFGKTVTESMACGTPVVATAVGGITEQVIEGETGVLSPPHDGSELAERALRLLGVSAGMREAAARRGRQFSLSAQAEAFLSWYGEILASRAGGAPS